MIPKAALAPVEGFGQGFSPPPGKNKTVFELMAKKGVLVNFMPVVVFSSNLSNYW